MNIEYISFKICPFRPQTLYFNRQNNFERVNAIFTGKKKRHMMELYDLKQELYNEKNSKPSYATFHQDMLLTVHKMIRTYTNIIKVFSTEVLIKTSKPQSASFFTEFFTF